MNTPTAPLYALLPIVLVLSWFFQRPIFHSDRKATYHQLLTSITQILHPPGATLKQMLKERAQSNQRLVRALGLTNTFVSIDDTVHDIFKLQARRLIRTAQGEGWTHFQAIARDAVRWQLHHQQDHTSFPVTEFEFDSFVQNITLMVVLLGILQVDKPVSTFHVHDITLVAKNITTLWTLSKQPERIPPQFLEELNVCLRRLVPDEEAFPNPLDFIVPAWETLWRVVATTVAHSHNDKDIVAIFEDFNRRPNEEEFRRSIRTGDIDVKSVVTEAMRLHPPSRRIGRSKPRMVWCPAFLEKLISPSLFRVNQNADIGEFLRCDIWGHDASTFSPSRHIFPRLGREQKEASKFAFGHGPLQCIASSWAPIAAAVVAGAILETFESGEYVLEAGPDIGGRAGWKGWLVKAM